jgi:hypothetical protein
MAFCVRKELRSNREISIVDLPVKDIWIFTIHTHTHTHTHIYVYIYIDDCMFVTKVRKNVIVYIVQDVEI